jgi:hypothetical protein
MGNEKNSFLDIPNSAEERSAFLKASLFRLVIGVWAIGSLIFYPFNKALITVFLLLLVLLAGETILSSMRLQAKYKAMRRVAIEAEAVRRKAKEEANAERLRVAAALEAAKSAAAEKYFDLDDENMTRIRKELDLNVASENGSSGVSENISANITTGNQS